MPKKKQKKGSEVPEWVVTYGDLMSLLLCFFILLAAFSELKQPREYRKVIEAIREALGFEGGLGQADIPDSPTTTTVNDLLEQATRDGQKLTVDENSDMSVTGRQSKTDIVHDGNWVSIGGTLGFEPGRWKLTRSMERKLRDEVAPKIRDRRNICYIVGHAWGYQDLISRDGSKNEADAAMAAQDTPGNELTHMGLSYLRSTAVYDYLVNECGIDRKILLPMAAGDSQPMALPTLGGNTQDGQNRRVQIYMTDRTIDDVHPDPGMTGR